MSLDARRLNALIAATILGTLPLGLGGCDGAVPTPAIFAGSTYADALKANASDGKILIVKATAEWCPPCKQMNRDTFTDQSVIDWINAHGVAIQLDTDENPSIAGELGVQTIPTLIVFRGGKEIARASGYQGAGEFVSWLDKSIAKK